MLHGNASSLGDIKFLKKKGIEANHPPADSLVHQAAQPAKMRVDGSRSITLFFQVETIFVERSDVQSRYRNVCFPLTPDKAAQFPVAVKIISVCTFAFGFADT